MTRGGPVGSGRVGALDGLVALVTGAGSGIGLATVQALSDRGAVVGALDVNPVGARTGVVPLLADVTCTASVDAAVAELTARTRRLDIVVNNAGVGAVGTVEDNSDEEWHRVYDVNVVGAVRTTRAALPALRSSPHAAVVNVASVLATAGLPSRACYSASKGALLSLTLAMAADLLADEVRVNCVCPGTIDTPWVSRLLDAAADPAAERASLTARQPMGRLGTADEVAATIAFLAGPDASFLTGVAVAVDGGLAGVRKGAQR